MYIMAFLTIFVKFFLSRDAHFHAAIKPSGIACNGFPLPGSNVSGRTGAGAMPPRACRQKVRSPSPHNRAASRVVNSSAPLIGRRQCLNVKFHPAMLHL
jgi:hypothetical protein